MTVADSISYDPLDSSVNPSPDGYSKSELFDGALETADNPVVDVPSTEDLVQMLLSDIEVDFDALSTSYMLPSNTQDDETLNPTNEQDQTHYDRHAASTSSMDEALSSYYESRYGPLATAPAASTPSHTSHVSAGNASANDAQTYGAVSPNKIYGSSYGPSVHRRAAIHRHFPGHMYSRPRLQSGMPYYYRPTEIYSTYGHVAQMPRPTYSRVNADRNNGQFHFLNLSQRGTYEDQPE